MNEVMAYGKFKATGVQFPLFEEKVNVALIGNIGDTIEFQTTTKDRNGNLALLDEVCKVVDKRYVCEKYLDTKIAVSVVLTLEKLNKD